MKLLRTHRVGVRDLWLTVYRDPRNKNFSHRAQHGMIEGIGEETKGYRAYFPEDKEVVAQHVKNIESLDRTQNEQVQRLYLREDSVEPKEESQSKDPRRVTLGTERPRVVARRPRSGAAKSRRRRLGRGNGL
ncbi:hypothetical protein PI125_g18693 [Phytophthora idaei]|nr:hypothetical protein PI125_g18693 [Phytophthora idaei]